MTDLRQAAQQALEALEHIDSRDNDSDFLQPHECYQLDAAIAALKAELDQPEQEPVACRFCHSKKGCWAWQCYQCGEIDDVQKPTLPAAQRPWVGLTDEDMKDPKTQNFDFIYGARWAEAKLKERNT
jgi:hypothetical protein